jgi:hypothetical protein
MRAKEHTFIELARFSKQALILFFKNINQLATVTEKAGAIIYFPV